MSWSNIFFGEYCAHAHDSEQETFMYLAPQFMDEEGKFDSIEWLQDWREFWEEHRNTFINGCSDIDLEKYLVCEANITQFKEFLVAYKSWLNRFGKLIPAEIMNERTNATKHRYFTRPVELTWLVGFVEKVEAVLGGNDKHKSVWRIQGT